MNKKYNIDDGLKQLVEDQYIKEAEMREKALFSNKDFEDYEMTDEEVKASYQDFLKRLEKEKIPPKKEKIIPLSKKRKIPVAKVAGIAALCVISVFAASMTGEANRRYVINSVRYLVGDDTRIVVDNDEENELPETDEYEAIAEIEETLGVEVPEFMYRPEGFEFRHFKVNRDSGNAWIEYKYKESVLTLIIDIEQENSASVIESLHGNDEESLYISGEEIKVTVKKIQESSDTEPSYFARWERNDVLYQIGGKIEEKTFYNMVKKIKF